MTSPPLVSIIIPLYNYAHYITECIASACAQTYTNLDIVVLDDGSKDNSLEVARQCTDPRVRVLHHPNRGSAGTGNRGFEEARGEYVAWLSADDLFHPTKIEKQMAAFAAHPDAACVYTNLTWRAEAEAALAWSPLPREAAQAALKRDGYVTWDTTYRPTPDDRILEHLLQTRIHIYLGTTLVPKQVLNELGLLDTQYVCSADYEFVMRLAAAGRRFVLVEEPLIICRAHADNTKGWEKIRADENRVRRLYLERCSLETFYPRLSEAGCTPAERAAILSEHVRWLAHHEMGDEARAAYQEHLRAAPTTSSSFELAKALAGRQLWPEAEAELRKLSREGACGMAASYLLGDACRKQGRWGDALGCYLRGAAQAVRAKP